MTRKIISLVLIACFLVVAVFAFVFYSQFNTPPDRTVEQVLFTVEKGDSFRTTASNLKNSGIIQWTWPLLLGYRIFFRNETLKAGEYALDLPMSYRQILIQLTEGQINLRSLTIPEGLTRRETATHLKDILFTEEADFLEASRNISLISDLDSEAENLEGYLFPETYLIPKKIAVAQIVDVMVEQFRQVFTPEWQQQTEEMEKSVREIVTLASLIEKETSLPEERELVSAVFHNRLNRRMKLDCDPTIIYALKEKDEFTGNLRKRHLAMDSPYNTYLYGGLPPGPIANPGKESLRAALYPADVDYLYFVSKNDGSHHFSVSFREHQNAVNRFQRRR